MILQKIAVSFGFSQILCSSTHNFTLTNRPRTLPTLGLGLELGLGLG